MWTSDSTYHSATPVHTGSTTGLHHPGVGAWSSPPKGRGHLWSALLLLAVGVVTLAVLAVVALAIVLGGMSGHSGNQKTTPVESLSPSASWGEEAEEIYRVPPPRQQLEQIIKTTAVPTSTSTLPPLPPSQSTTVKKVIATSTTTTTTSSTTSTSTTTTTTTKPPIVIRTTPRSAIQEVKAPILTSLDESRRTFANSAIPQLPGAYQIRGSVDFSREKTKPKYESPKEKKEEDSWSSEVELRHHAPVAVGEAEPVGEAVVSTLQEVLADTSRLPARSYSGVNGVSLRPMPTFFPPEKKDIEKEMTTISTTKIITQPTQASFEKRLLEVDSPFFIESLKSLPPTKVTPSVVSKLEINSNIEETTKINLSTELNHRRGIIDSTIRPVPNYHLINSKDIPKIEKNSSSISSSTIVSPESLSKDVTSHVTVTHEQKKVGLVELLHLPASDLSTEDPLLLVSTMDRLNEHLFAAYSTSNPQILNPTYSQSTDAPLIKKTTTPMPSLSLTNITRNITLDTKVNTPSFNNLSIKLETNKTDSVILVPTVSHSTEKPISIFDINTTNPVIFKPTYYKPNNTRYYNDNKTTHINNSTTSNPPKFPSNTDNNKNLATEAPIEDEEEEEKINTSIKISPTLEIVVENINDYDETLTLVKSISPGTTTPESSLLEVVPTISVDDAINSSSSKNVEDDLNTTVEVPKVTESPTTVMTSRAASVPSPTLAGILRPASTGQRTAEVEALGPIKAGILLREPKSGAPSKETYIQGFPKSEFNSAPSFLLNQRRNNTGKKPLTMASGTMRTPVTTEKTPGNCTCGDRLRAQGLGRKLCDGVVDCWDYSDEENCEWCGPGQYVCAHSRACVAKGKVCDGRRDCPFGDDERMCVSIAPDLEQANTLHYHDDGLLMVQQSGKWGPLCVEKLDGSAWRLGDVARAVCRALTYRDFELAEQVMDPLKMGPYFELNFDRNASRNSPRLAVRSSDCPSRAAVRLGCRELQCGVRPLAVSQWARPSRARRCVSNGARVRGCRIVGGGNAGPGAWPWQAALYKEGQFQCGGSLINSQWLLSASHCFAHNLDAYWVARLGALRRGTDLASPFEQLRRVVHITQHPGYLDTGFINDLALLKLERPVDFSDYVRPVCLPQPSAAPENKNEENVPEGHMCTVVGWGQLSEVGRIFPDTLQEVQLPLIPTEECRRRTVFLPLYRVTEDMFCAGYDRGGRDACLGDSGGPLMCQRPDGHWELTGITSNGYGCARAHRPGVYTKVANYVHWIAEVIRSGSIQLSKNDIIVPQCQSGHRRCALGQCVPKSEDRCDKNYCPPPS